MIVPQLTTIEITTKKDVCSSIIWMHGLGADAHDFEPIVPELNLSEQPGIRFIFPNAPIQPVTVNGGMEMRAWYNILSIDLPRSEDHDGIYISQQAINKIIENEEQRGIPANKIVLAGFSQGGAMALYTGLLYEKELAGIIALSCYIPAFHKLKNALRSLNTNIPIFMAHGKYDNVIPFHYGEDSFQSLKTLNYLVSWYSYNMGHEVCREEILDIASWIKKILN